MLAESQVSWTSGPQIDWEDRKVYILAIGVKDRDRLFIGGEEVEL